MSLLVLDELLRWKESVLLLVLDASSTFMCEAVMFPVLVRLSRSGSYKKMRGSQLSGSSRRSHEVASSTNCLTVSSTLSYIFQPRINLNVLTSILQSSRNCVQSTSSTLCLHHATIAFHSETMKTQNRGLIISEVPRLSYREVEWMKVSIKSNFQNANRLLSRSE